MSEFKRITKRQAQKAFSNGQIVYFCPCKMRPGFPWNLACPIHPKEHIAKAEYYADNHNPQLWKGSIEKTAWALAYNAWAFYNTNYEMGYYAHYYLEN